MNPDKDTLVVNNLTIHFGKTQVLNNISFNLKAGEILAVVGPSGCGKSTLLNVLSGIIKQFDGEIKFRDIPLQNNSIRCGYVPQTLGLLPWKKIKENIFLPFRIDQIIKLNQDDAAKIIAELGISSLLNRYPSQLSGGQKQRVALARVFIAQPDLLLMDEPFSALDTITAETSRNLFFEVWKKHRPTTVFTTHNLNEATSLGKYILLLGELSSKESHWIENPFFDPEPKQLVKEDFHRFVLQLKKLMRESMSTDDKRILLHE